MKITKTRLRQIIREEVSRLDNLRESPTRSRTTSSIMSVLRDLAPGDSKGIAHEDLIKAIKKEVSNLHRTYIESTLERLRDEGEIDDGVGGTWKPAKWDSTRGAFVEESIRPAFWSVKE